MSSPVVGISVIGFFTFMMFWTLNGNSGQDMNDVVVQYMEQTVQQMEVK